MARHWLALEESGPSHAIELARSIVDPRTQMEDGSCMCALALEAGPGNKCNYRDAPTMHLD